MVQVCPNCGMSDPDDKAVFCNRCGDRLPPRIPEKKEKLCPGCGTKIADIHAVFCDRCGSPLPAAPPAYTGAPPAAARPATGRERCPSCGAPRVDGTSAYCNKCGALFRAPAPASVSRSTDQPYPEKPGGVPAAAPGERCPSCGAPRVDGTSAFCNKCGALFRAPAPAGAAEKHTHPPEKPGPGTPVAPMPVAGTPAGGSGGPAPEKSQMSRWKRGLAALAAVMVLAFIAASFFGMIPGMTPSSNATPSPTLTAQGTKAPLPATVRTTTKAPALTPSPAKTTAPPATVVTKTTSPPGTANASAPKGANTSANQTANASAPVVTIPTITSSSQPLSIGQGAYDGKGKLTVNGIAFRDKMSDPTPSYAIGMQYLIVNITYENVQQNGTVDTDLSRVKVTDAGGFSHEQVSDVLLENVYLRTTLLPRQNRTGNLLFVVPPQAMYLNLEYRFGNQTVVKFQLT